MRFSVLIPTLNRAELLKCCIESLLAQTFSDFEIIVVDQSDDAMVDSSIEHMDSRICYLRITERGLSHARNIGITHARGEYICLGDDDATFSPSVLEIADSILKKDSPSILGGKLVDPSTGIARSDSTDTWVSWGTAFKYLVSPGMFIEKNLLVEHPFDEQFGVGAPFGCGEETDVVLYALKEGRRVLYADKYTILHHVDRGNLPEVERVKSYSYGYGALCRKCTREYSFSWGLHYFLRTIAGNAVLGNIVLPFTDRQAAAVRRARAAQTWRGFWAFRAESGIEYVGTDNSLQG